jgi:hypothetical protein
MANPRVHHVFQDGEKSKNLYHNNVILVLAPETSKMEIENSWKNL